MSLAIWKFDHAQLRFRQRINELETALKHAEEALFWHDGMAFEMDGKIVGQVIVNALGRKEEGVMLRDVIMDDDECRAKKSDQAIINLFSAVTAVNLFLEYEVEKHSEQIEKARDRLSQILDKAERASNAA